MLENLIFLSYRRADSAPHTLALKLELEDRFRAAQVFVDTHHISGADRWAAEIEDAVRAAKVVVPIIGPNWVGRTENGRRIDDPDDWVRKEVEFALEWKPNAVLPVLVAGDTAFGGRTALQLSNPRRYPSVAYRHLRLAPDRRRRRADPCRPFRLCAKARGLAIPDTGPADREDHPLRLGRARTAGA